MSPPIDDDVADIDADAKLDALLMWHVGVTLRHATLNIDGTTHRVHDAVELGQQPIAGVLDDPPTVLRDLGIDEGTQMVLELDVGGLFIEARQPAVAGHIGRKDGREASLYALRGQSALQCGRHSLPDGLRSRDRLRRATPNAG
jgi:hypothetical protein